MGRQGAVMLWAMSGSKEKLRDVLDGRSLSGGDIVEGRDNNGTSQLLSAGSQTVSGGSVVSKHIIIS